jgi:hypothetical protein
MPSHAPGRGVGAHPAHPSPSTSPAALPIKSPAAFPATARRRPLRHPLYSLPFSRRGPCNTRPCKTCMRTVRSGNQLHAALRNGARRQRLRLCANLINHYHLRQPGQLAVLASSSQSARHSPCAVICARLRAAQHQACMPSQPALECKERERGSRDYAPAGWEYAKQLIELCRIPQKALEHVAQTELTV